MTEPNEPKPQATLDWLLNGPAPKYEAEKKKGMMVYLDKSTPVLVQYADKKSFNKAKSVSRRAGQSSCIRNVLDAGGRLQ